MAPRLVVLDGPLAGRMFPLRDGEQCVGRQAGSDIVVADNAASREHCTITWRDGVCMVADRRSRHGTWVNEVAVESARLEPGDRLRVGNTVLVLQDDGSASAPAVSLLDDGDSETATAAGCGSHAAGPSRYLRGEPGAAWTAPESARLARLVELSAGLGELHAPDVLGGRMLDWLVATLPADRVALLRGAETEPGANGIVVRARPGLDAEPLRLSRTLLARAREERGGHRFVFGVPGGEGAPDSVAGARVGSALVVPLVAHGRVAGIVYADRLAGSPPFAADDLELMAAVAALAALALEAARAHTQLVVESERRHAEFARDSGLIGSGPRMQALRSELERVAPHTTTVLLRGETGTGKELAARTLHALSPRARRAFVAVNCAAIPDTLLESELFGHERGAFSGAVALKPGRVESAEGGTLFLDEIGDLPPSMQVKLLRFLEQRSFERVGGTRSIPLDVRVVAATNRDLEAAMTRGEFREDLYYRLSVVVLRLPALRERREDIPELAASLLDRLGSRLGIRRASIAPEALARMALHPWPGNVRELENALERALVLGAGERIELGDLAEAVQAAGGAPEADAELGRYHGAVQELKRRLVREALRESDDNFAEAARRLGLNPTYLYRLASSLGLRPPQR